MVREGSKIKRIQIQTQPQLDRLQYNLAASNSNAARVGREDRCLSLGSLICPQERCSDRAIKPRALTAEKVSRGLRHPYQ